MGMRPRNAIAVAAVSTTAVVVTVGLAAPDAGEGLALSQWGQAVAAGVGALACGLAAHHTRGRARSVWALFSLALAIWTLTEGAHAVALIAGYVGVMVDTVIMRVMDIILAFPSLLLAPLLLAVLAPGLTHAMTSISLVLQPHFVRLTRASVLAEKQREYVTAARVVGAGPLRLMLVTILPNCLGPLIVQATLSFSNAILDAAALGFLGMGAQPPTPEWGTMLADSREFISRAPWLVTFPGIAILVTVLAINLVGDGLRDTLDPKLKRS